MKSTVVLLLIFQIGLAFCSAFERACVQKLHDTTNWELEELGHGLSHLVQSGDLQQASSLLKDDRYRVKDILSPERLCSLSVMYLGKLVNALVAMSAEEELVEVVGCLHGRSRCDDVWTYSSSSLYALLKYRFSPANTPLVEDWALEVFRHNSSPTIMAMLSMNQLYPVERENKALSPAWTAAINEMIFHRMKASLQLVLALWPEFRERVVITMVMADGFRVGMGKRCPEMKVLLGLNRSCYEVMRSDGAVSFEEHLDALQIAGDEDTRFLSWAVKNNLSLDATISLAIDTGKEEFLHQLSQQGLLTAAQLCAIFTAFPTYTHSINRRLGDNHRLQYDLDALTLNGTPVRRVIRDLEDAGLDKVTRELHGHVLGYVDKIGSFAFLSRLSGLCRMRAGMEAYLATLPPHMWRYFKQSPCAMDHAGDLYAMLKGTPKLVIWEYLVVFLENVSRPVLDEVKRLLEADEQDGAGERAMLLGEIDYAIRYRRHDTA